MEYNNLIDKYLDKYGDPETERFVDLSLDFVDEIHNILEELGISQKELSKRMNKSAAEVSKWLSGNHNMTFKSIAKISVALDEDIILTTTTAKQKYGGHTTKVISLGVQHSFNRGHNQGKWKTDYKTHNSESIENSDLNNKKNLAVYGW